MNWVVAFTTPIFLAKSSYGVYFLFGGCLLLTVAVCLFIMPETTGKTLEDIDASFGKKLGKRRASGVVMELRDLEYTPCDTPVNEKECGVGVGVGILSSSSSVF